MLPTHDFREGELVLVSTVHGLTGRPSGVAMRGVITALMQHDRLRVRLSDELTVLVEAADCRREGEE